MALSGLSQPRRAKARRKARSGRTVGSMWGMKSLAISGSASWALTGSFDLLKLVKAR